jgi:nucleoside-diphosphate-sugar epimerase
MFAISRVKKNDFILHMAGHASPDEYMVHPIATLQTSALGTENMAELARKKRCGATGCCIFRGLC